MSKPIRFDAEAEEELLAAATWYEKQQSGLARGLLYAVNSAVERIRSGPSRSSVEPNVPRSLEVRCVFVQKSRTALSSLCFPRKCGCSQSRMTGNSPITGATDCEHPTVRSKSRPGALPLGFVA